ncbi:16S rRNA (guanine966-N2)-methyltransferase [Amycolatopsis marina]|uniref:16S rRNA (Guanine966-N2)-methyltransferase n=1 Tax=Amycolatopsis marina TaxID=490629 RepID=A0A1I0YF79_9PSEU|nr:16S rRNA (guanine(966)-N(2))-methyltransferase RsmD [Amycolatopsis marina]SFB11832.1 16S rRNA (guanine966-N2)-methyltransferase [Amycolatopsis marina]
MSQDVGVTRIVAGQAGGRRLRVPPRGTRPTSERVREALFNALEVAGELDGARVLDLYAGSGALGLEALSRGAGEAVFVEADRSAVEVLRGNIAAVGLGGRVRHGRVDQVLAESAPDSAAPFDLVLADPPYAVGGAELTAMLAALPRGGWVAAGGLVVVERAERDGEPDWPSGFDPLRSRRYGDTALYRAEYTG